MSRILMITGVNGSLGKGATEILLEKNYDRIYLCDRKQIDWVDDSENVIKIIVDDLSNENVVKKLFDSIRAEASDNLFLFSTIGGFYAAKIGEVDESKLIQQFDINTKSAFLLAKHFYLSASSIKGGSICFTSAQTAEKASAGKSVYGASKAALEYLVKSLALEWRDLNLTANAIAPFALDTPENREWIKDTNKLASPAQIGERVNYIFEKVPDINGEIVKMPMNIE